MDSIALDCHVCAKHVDEVIGAIGGTGPALAVAADIGSPLRPDLSSGVRVNSGIYLRVASDGLVRRFAEGGRSALPLCDAIQAGQMLICFSHVKRSWDSSMANSTSSNGLGIATQVTWTLPTPDGAISRWWWSL